MNHACAECRVRVVHEDPLTIGVFTANSEAFAVNFYLIRNKGNFSAKSGNSENEDFQI